MYIPTKALTKELKDLKLKRKIFFLMSFLFFLKLTLLIEIVFYNDCFKLNFGAIYTYKMEVPFALCC